MKTKHILTALALPALFAACTAEDIVNEGTAALQERPTVQNLTVRVIEGAESRYAVSGTSSLKFNFETGDKFGAAIIDEYQPGVKPENWEVIPSLAGNTPFTYNANSGEWKAPEDLPMGLGHYLFVYPYNRADVNRAAVSYELPVIQKLYTEEDGEIDLNAAIEAGNKSFYSTVVTSPDVEDLDIDLKNLYAYPKFVINFDNGEKVTTVSKVVLAKTGGFEVKGGFDHEVVAGMFADNADSKFWTSTTSGAIDKTTDWNKVQTADVLTADENYATIETCDYLVAELPLNTRVEEVTNNKYIEVRFMMPGELIGNDAAGLKDYTMYVYTNNGAYSFNLYSAVEFKLTTKPSSINRAIARGTANTITINKDKVKKDNKAPFIVTNVADWNELVEAYGDEDVFAKNNPVEVVYVGSSLVLDETAEMPTEAYFHVNSVTVEGDVELCNVIADEVIVEEGATLTTCATFTAASIVNKGELNVEAVYNSKGKSVEYSGMTAINNYGVLNVEEEAIADFYLINQKGAVLNNEGTLTIATLYAISAGDIVQSLDGNNGIINNAGTINMGHFNNLAPEYKGTKLVNMPTINNEGKILTKGDVTNFGTVINEGTLSCKNQDGTFINNNILDAKEDGLTYITENNGEVIVYAPFQDDVVIEKQKGIVSYTTIKASESFYVATTGATSYVNNIYVSDDYTLSATNSSYAVTLNVEGDANIARAYDATKGYLAHVSALNVLEGTTILGSDFYVKSIYVEEDAMVRVLAGKALEISSSDFENYGEIEVAGNFAALNVSGKSKNAGIVTESGANAKIYWKENADEWNAATTKEAALAEALAEYMDEDNGAGEYAEDHNYVLTLSNFNAHLDRVVKLVEDWNTDEEYPKAYYFATYYKTTAVSQSELDAAAAKIAKDNKKELIEKLETMTITLKDSELYGPTYVNGVVTVTAKAKAYAAFKEDVVKNEIETDKDNSVNYAANALSETEIDAILAEAAPYAYIWEGGNLDKLVKIWVKYNGLTKSAWDYSMALADEKVGIEYLKKFMIDCKGATSAAGLEIKELIKSWDIPALNKLGYTDDQVKACANVNTVVMNNVGIENY